jgi:hypothetical protein
MVRKATTKAVATKKVSKVKATPKARPATVYSIEPIEVPQGKLNHLDVMNFLASHMKPPFGKLSKSIDLHNNHTKEQVVAFFRKHPDADKTGVYVLQRKPIANTIFLHQVVQGQAEAVLALSIDVVRRGPKTIEYIYSATEATPTRATHQLAQGVDDQVREQVETLVGQRDATTEPVEGRRELPSLFHHDYQRLTVWLQDYAKNAALGEDIKANIASLVGAASQSGIVTEDMIGQVVFTTARMAGTSSDPEAAAGLVQLQLYTADHAGSKPPFGVIDMGTAYQINEGGTRLTERVSKVFAVRQNPFGTAPKQQPGGWVPGAARSRWGADAQALFGEQNRREAGAFRPATAMPVFGGQLRTFGTPGFGMGEQRKPETFDVTTSSLARFIALMNVLVDDQHEMVNKSYVDQLKEKVQSMFYNQAASQQGSLLFDFKFMSGHSLLVIVRDRATQLTHFIETIQLA